MITQNEASKNRLRFWKVELSDEIKRDLRLTLGLIKSMTANAYQQDKKDDSGLYHSSILAEERIEDLHDRLEEMIGDVLDQAIASLQKP